MKAWRPTAIATALLGALASCSEHLAPPPQPAALIFALEPRTDLTESDTFTVVVRAVDAWGNLAAGFAGAVAVAVAGGPSDAVLLGQTSANAVAGEATFSGLSLDRGGEGYALVANADGLAPDTTPVFDVSGLVVGLRFTGQPTNQFYPTVMRSAFCLNRPDCQTVFAVSAVDRRGDVATSFEDTVSVTLGVNPVAAPLALRLQAVKGVASQGIVLPRASGYTLLASSGTLGTVESAAFTSWGPAPVRLSLVLPYPLPKAEGSFEVRAALVDPDAGVAGEVNGGSVLLNVDSAPAGGAITGPSRATVKNGVAAFSALTATAPGRYVLSAAQDSGGSLQSWPEGMEVGEAPAAAVAFLGQQPTRRSGEAFPASVEIQSAGGNRTNAYTGSVSLALGANPSGAVLAGTLTVQPTDGLAVFPAVTIDRPGVGYTLIASAPGLVVGESALFDVSGLGLAFSAPPPASSEAGSLPEVVVEARDSGGSLATAFSDSVRLSLDAGPSDAGLAGTTTVLANGGVARFGDLRLTVTGGGYRLRASSAGAGASTSDEFVITPTGGAHPVFLTQPLIRRVGSPAQPRVEATIAVADSFGNLDTRVSDAVIVRLAPHPSGSDTLFGPRMVTLQSGSLLFSALRPWMPGSGYRLTLEAGGLTDTSATFGVAVQEPITTRPRIQPPDSVVAGTPFSVAFDAVDADGFPIADTTRVDLYLNQPVPDDVPIQRGVVGTTNHTRGVATFSSVVVDAAGSYFLIAAASAASQTVYPSKVFTVVAPAGPP